MDAAFVALFDGKVEVPHLTGQPGVERAVPKDVVCVVLSSGEPFIYTDVSRDGLALPAGAHIGPVE